MLSHIQPIERAGHPVAASRAEFIAGMQLLRAVSMQSVRLQLAMLKRGRRPALESFDTLAEMDRELEQFIEGIGPDGLAPQLAEISELVARQKTALANEKIALMAGISGPGMAQSHAPIPSSEMTPGPEPFAPRSEYRASGLGVRIVAFAAMVVLAVGGVLAWRNWGALAPLIGL